ncbi:MAG: S9 family peptidase [Clostridia bacterium]|nr:S9 family peptidase [Clostridia bacterium]
MRQLCEEDLRKVRYLSDPQLSPTGEMGAFVLEKSRYEDGTYIPSVYGVHLPQGDTFPLLPEGSFHPRFSPDGRQIAYLQRDPATRLQKLHVLDLVDGTAYSPCPFQRDVEDVLFHPRGAVLVIIVRARPEETAEDLMRPETPPASSAFSTGELMYKLDEEGYLDGRVRRLYLVSLVRTFSPICLSDPKTDAFSPVFQGADRLLFFARTESRERSLHACLQSVPVYGGKAPETIPAALSPDSGVPVLCRGDEIICCGADESGKSGIYALNPAAHGERCLSERLQGDVHPPVLGDEMHGEESPALRQDPRGTLYALTGREAKTLLELPEEGRSIPLPGALQSFSIGPDGRILAVVSTPTSPMELYAIDTSDGNCRQLTHENDWAGDLHLPGPVSVPFLCGGREVAGQVFLPEGEEPCPGILYVHGGPECFWGRDVFFFEAQALRARGYAVMVCNPRGSSSYGQDFLEGAYGDEAMHDLHAFLDACLKQHPRIDPARLGITGGSYGGYMTVKMCIESSRFRAAAAQRPWVNPITSYGTGDMGFMSGSEEHDFRAYMLRRAKGSILRDIQKLNVPMLLLHGEKDFRCHVEQSDQIFSMMRVFHPEIPSRIVIFPGENHNVSRGGLMHHRIRHLREIGDWMDRFLKDAPEENAGKDTQKEENQDGRL